MASAEPTTIAAPATPAAPAPNASPASPAAALNLQGVRRIVHLDGTTQEDAFAGAAFRGRRRLSAPVEGAWLAYGSPKLVSAYRTLPTQFVKQKESGYYRVAGELVDEKVYEGRKLVAELVDEKVYEGRKLVGELVDEKVTMGKAAILSVEVAQPASHANVTVRELPEVVRSVKVLEPKYVQGAASQKVTINTYVTVGEPVIYELPPAMVTDATPIYLGGRAYLRTDAGFSPIHGSTAGHSHTARYGVVRGSPSIRSASPASSVGSPTFSSPTRRLRSAVRVASPLASSITPASP